MNREELRKKFFAECADHFGTLTLNNTDMWEWIEENCLSQTEPHKQEDKCFHNNTIFQNLRCNVCKDCGEIIETDV